MARLRRQTSGSKRRSFPPEVPVAALRDHAADADAIERMWQRLDEELPSKLEGRASPGGRRGTWVWSAAAAALLFASGVLVGSRFGLTPAPQAVPQAEPAPTDRAAGDEAEPAPAPSDAPPLDTAKPHEPRLAPLPRAPRAEGSASIDGEPQLVARPVGPPEWQRLADAGEYAAAYRVVQNDGGFAAAMAQASADQLMTLAEVARANRQRALATQALRQLLARYPGDPNAPLAALSLGNLLEAAGDKRGAAAAFALYRSLSPDGDFAEDALARQVMSAIEQGHLELARKLAGQYEKDYPSGRRGQEIRDALSEAEASDAGVAQPAADAGVEPPAAPGAPAAPPAAPAGPPASAGQAPPPSH